MQLFLHLLWLQICCNHILGFPSLTFFARHSSTNLLYLLFILFGHQSHFNYQSNSFELSFSRISDSTLKWIFHVFLQWKNLLIHLTLPYGLFYNHCSLCFGCPSVCLFFFAFPCQFLWFSYQNSARIISWENHDNDKCGGHDRCCVPSCYVSVVVQSMMLMSTLQGFFFNWRRIQRNHLPVNKLHGNHYKQPLPLLQEPPTLPTSHCHAHLLPLPISQRRASHWH